MSVVQLQWADDEAGTRTLDCGREGVPRKGEPVAIFTNQGPVCGVVELVTWFLGDAQNPSTMPSTGFISRPRVRS